MKVRFTPSARRHFLAALGYVRKDSPLGAQRLRARVERALRRLQAHPLSGRKIPEFPLLPHREVISPPYRFFYRIEGKIVWIVAVWHGKQLPTDPDPQSGVSTSRG